MGTATLPSAGYDLSLKNLYDFLLAAPQMVNSWSAHKSGAAPTDLQLNAYESRVTTSGSAGVETVNLGSGAGVVPGQRKLVTLTAKGAGGDSLDLDAANIIDSGGTQATGATITTAGKFILFQWNGAKWQVVYISATGASITTGGG